MMKTMIFSPTEIRETKESAFGTGCAQKNEAKISFISAGQQKNCGKNAYGESTNNRIIRKLDSRGTGEGGDGPGTDCETEEGQDHGRQGTVSDGVPAETVRRAVLSEGRTGGVYGQGEIGQDVRHVDDDGGSVGGRGLGIPQDDV